MRVRNRSLYRTTALGLAVAATTMLLTSCTHGDDDTARGRTGGTPDVTPSGSPDTAVHSPEATRAPSPSAAASTAASPPASRGAQGVPAGARGCRSLLASSATKATVTAAYRGQSRPPVTHIAPVKGTFFYGSCDGVRYAGIRFRLTAGSTEAERVTLQDEGAGMKYFVARPGAGWRYVASDGFPAPTHGCADVSQIPDRLAALWNDCHSAVDMR
ncbi:hypothetical protein ACIPRD_13175 [Streptomyces sp. NPDC090108]|uniref:hypothetical protein n=1 Tax=Streptomyces sp. NPDC090108 TaxID=3365947 RepID=UPI0037F64EEB